MFVVARYEPQRVFVLTTPSSDGGIMSSWAFILEEARPGWTRLLVRGRAGEDYHLLGLPTWFLRLAGPFGHGIMQRKQLLGIKERVEGRR